MLVLTRKPGEELIIGDDVRICVLEVIGQKVRLGITAPRDVTIHRAEVYRSIVEFQWEKPPSTPRSSPETDSVELAGGI